MPWDLLLALAVNRLNLRPGDFWNLTFGEWWPIYNAVFGKTQKPMTKADLEKLEEAWLNGNNRRVGNKA